MKMPRLTDDKRCKSKEEAIAYAMQQIEVIKQGKEPLSPSMKEKRQAMEMYDKEAKEIEKLITKTSTNYQPINTENKKYNPFIGQELRDGPFGGKIRGD
ncbi:MULTISPECIES: hypothetical protein [unclassified Arsenophonus]|uniref:hypothetical protein n=1 Tax=unclassified Arsenophonus TaxID=2627083 RepID=UPI002859622E|nr:hypothetical protein [Arsenophonus sp.]MDR5611294.1 hypothetical protein [Arsenophonus sp.]MDR5615312.1 hypothetical protein [Arsenophonus sp.]MDR5616803.1 hypothetical protein [Arsenophonus sp.]MDR5618331.1 hypothetical protein [Arsenophonus sp.]